jgi:hypothetical protein
MHFLGLILFVALMAFLIGKWLNETPEEREPRFWKKDP